MAGLISAGDSCGDFEGANRKFRNGWNTRAAPWCSARMREIRQFRALEWVGRRVRVEPPSEAKLKHLDFLQGAISRMASISSLYKGWAITIATTLSGFAAVQSQSALLLIAILSTMLFWTMDAYYLWLERGFVRIYQKVAATANEDIDFMMAIDKNDGFRRWLRTCARWHLVLFYGSLVTINMIGIVLLRGDC